MPTFLSWLETFGNILIRPTPHTFTTEAKKAGGKTATAIAWLVVTIVLFHLWAYLVGSRFRSLTIAASILLFPIIFLFYTFCVHFLYTRLLHRTKYHYDEFLYLMVGIFVPYTLLASLVTPIPRAGNYLSGLVMGLAVILTILAVKTVAHLKTWQSIAIVLLSTLLTIGGYLCIPTFILSTMFNMKWMISP